jgi:ABC-2 type transport system permease protein
MKGKASRFNIFLTIIKKDLYLTFREFLFVFLTILSVVTFVVLYWVLPKDADETISLAIKGRGLEQAFNAMAEETGETEEGLKLTWFEDLETLTAAVEEGDAEVGVAFPDSFMQSVAAGEKVTVTIYARPSLPSEYSFAISSMVKEIAYAVAGHALPVSEPDEEMVILGPDRAGDQLAIREQMRPLYAFMVLLMEAIALAALIASEIQHRTIIAMLATPAKLTDILGAKTVVGILIAFGEAALVMLLIQGYGSAPGIVLMALFLGAVLVTGVAMISGSSGKDLVGTMMLGVVFLIPLMIPAIAVLFPGTAAVWVRVLPSYGLVQAIITAGFHDGGWAGAAPHLGILALWCIAVAGIGILVLRRRINSL